MREIKFRVWDAGKKHIRYYDSFEEFCGQYYAYGNTIFQPLQGTGLEDKNHKHIYEGDIITHEVNNMIGVVTWGTYGFVIENLDRTEIIADLSDYDYNPVVIGNIYENPELLK